MADLPRRPELFRRWRNGALAVPSTRISPLEVDREGSDVNLIGASDSLMGEEIVGRMARAYANCFEDTAKGDGLDRVVFDRKGLPRKPAEFSVGSVLLSRPTAGAGAGTVDGGLPGATPAPTRIQTNRGITVLLTQPAIFGALALGPIQVTAQAELAGLDQEVGKDQTWSFVDVPFDPTITIANPVAFAGAADEEEDDDYKARAKAFFPTIRRGTLGAIEFGLINTPGIASAAVIEVVDEFTGFPACMVQAFILDSLGQANETLAARGLLNLLEYRGGGIPVIATPGTPQFVTIRIVGSEFDTRIVLDTASAAEDVRTRIVAALNDQRSGAKLLRSTILAAARTVPGFIIEDTDLVEPAATLLPASSDVAFRTRRELIEIG